MEFLITAVLPTRGRLVLRAGHHRWRREKKKRTRMVRRFLFGVSWLKWRQLWLSSTWRIGVSTNKSYIQYVQGCLLHT